MIRHFTATAFVLHDGKVLLLKHRSLGRWMPPGGHVDEHETPDETARRECKEETGLDVEILGEPQEDLFAENVHEGRMLKKPFAMLLENIPENPAKNMPAHEHMDFLYRARLIDSGQTLTLEAEAGEELRWFTKEEVEQLDATTEIFANVKAYVLGVLE